MSITYLISSIVNGLVRDLLLVALTIATLCWLVQQRNYNGRWTLQHDSSATFGSSTVV